VRIAPADRAAENRTLASTNIRITKDR